MKKIREFYANTLVIKSVDVTSGALVSKTEKDHPLVKDFSEENRK